MKEIRCATEEEMILSFLQMELNSKRFRTDIVNIMSELNMPLSLVTDGNLKNFEQNKLRRQLLSAYRGYPNKQIFEKYPNNVVWKYVVLEAGDIDKFRYIDYSYWNELSNNTSLPTEGAKTVMKGKQVFDVSNDVFYDALNYLKAGKVFAPIILTTHDMETFRILEGHVRTTVYALNPGSEANTHAYVGVYHEK